DECMTGHDSSLKEVGLCGRDAVAVVPGRPVAGDGGEDAVRRALPNAVITRVSDVDAPVRAARNAARKTQPRLGGRPAVAVEAVLPVSRKGGDDSRCVHTPHNAAGGIGDVDVALAVNGHALGSVNLGLRRGPAVATVIRNA